MYVPEGNQAVIEAFQTSLRPEVPVLLFDLHINDPEFGDLVTNCMERLLGGERPGAVAAELDGGTPGL